MSGVAILVLLAIMLIDHRVSSRTSVESPIEYDNAKLSAMASHIVDKVIFGTYYYHDGSVGLPSNLCCLTFVKKERNADCDNSVPIFPSGCICNVVYQAPVCSNVNSMASFARSVQQFHGSSVIFTIEDAEQGSFVYKNPSLRIPVMFVNDEESQEFYATLRDEVNVTVMIERFDTPNPDTGNGFNNGRSATTFYFVVFAFTILLLLSLTWFVFNYLRRCHHMYTVKRQRAEMLSKTRRAIDKCPTKTYKKIKKTMQKTNKDEVDSVISEEEERCPICLETFKMKDMLRVLPCHHEFHKSCIDPWLYEKGTCPMCKLNIVGNQEECDSEQVSRDLRILTMEEGISTASSHTSGSQQQSTGETLQVESIE